ncbi:hypothetical protein [Actinoplanes sp. NPDC051494]|uniref:hypothetical protein n=1 Tax=Actinoplanes sp. NPDC051494 TaxID=3363907 RepID=UPI0037B85005
MVWRSRGLSHEDIGWTLVIRTSLAGAKLRARGQVRLVIVGRTEGAWDGRVGSAQDRTWVRSQASTICPVKAGRKEWRGMTDIDVINARSCAVETLRIDVLSDDDVSRMFPHPRNTPRNPTSCDKETACIGHDGVSQCYP